MNTQKSFGRRAAVLALAIGLVLSVAVAAQARNAIVDAESLDLTMPVSADASVEGAGLAQFPGCAPTYDTVTISGSGKDNVWTFSYSTQNHGCDDWTNSATMTGPWNPATGGCVTFNFFYQLCLTGPVGQPGVAAVYSYSNSFDLNAGNVLLVFA